MEDMSSYVYIYIYLHISWLLTSEIKLILWLDEITYPQWKPWTIPLGKNWAMSCAMEMSCRRNGVYIDTLAIPPCFSWILYLSVLKGVVKSLQYEACAV